jgi:hypothetical protein
MSTLNNINSGHRGNGYWTTPESVSGQKTLFGTIAWKLKNTTLCLYVELQGPHQIENMPCFFNDA